MDTNTNMFKILIVDDVAKNIQVAASILKDYNISFANDGDTAIKLATSYEDASSEDTSYEDTSSGFDLILLDIMMPGMDGFETCRKLKENKNTKNIPIIFLTSKDDKESIIEAFDIGAVDYITKPFNSPELQARVKTHLELKRHRDHLEKMVFDRTKQLRNILEQSLGALAASLEKKDPYTAGHQKRVAELAKLIAIDLKLPEEQIQWIEMAALIHDIGKICVPSELLAIPRKLSSIEMELIKTHAKAGFDIINEIDFPWPIAQIILQHHEYLDGTGYPRGLKSEDIMLESKILTVADVLEAMSYHRPYRPALGRDSALKQILEFRGVLYDPDVVDSCERIIVNKKIKLL